MKIDRQVITIQVSSFRKAEDAERDLARFKSHGMDAFVSYEPVKDKGMWYRDSIFGVRRTRNE